MEEGAPATAATASSNSEPVARVAKRLEDDRVQHDAAIESDVAAKQLTAGLQARPVLATVIEQQQQPALAAPAAPELRPTPFDREVTPPVEAAEVAAAVGGEPTVTINTAQAFAAINGMFGGTLGGGATCAPAGMEPTVTISTAEAFAAVNQMFKGGLPAEAGGCLPLHPGAEPTMSLGNVTLSTRDAFTAINRMFKVGPKCLELAELQAVVAA